MILTRTEIALRFRALVRTDWQGAERQLAAALVRERAGSLVPDGYRRSARSNGARGSDGGDPTSLAALARAEPDTWRADQHRLHALSACDELTTLIESYNRLFGHLTAITQLVDPDSARMPDCAPCAAGGVHHTARHWSTVGGRLAQPTHVCKQVYEFVRRHGRVPTPEEARSHDRTGRWRITVSPPDRRPRWPTKT